MESKDNQLREEIIEKKINKRRFIIQITVVVMIIAVCIALTIYFWPKFKEIQQNKEKFAEQVKGMGFTAVFIVLAISCIQVILAVIPGEIVEIICGVMYGPWLGLLICEIGIALGCATVYYLVKLLGTGFAKSMVNLDLQKKFKLFGDPRRVEVLMFFILLMPGIPKDFVAFIVPMTKVKLRRFLILNAIARIPSILSSTLIGNSVLVGEWSLSIILMIISGIIALLGLIFNKRIVQFIIKRGDSKKEVSKI